MARKVAREVTRASGRAVAGLEPPKKVSEVKAWVAAHAADPRAFDALAKTKKRSAPCGAASIRALAAIGGARALETLATYRGEEPEGAFGDTFHDAVARELKAAWKRFDRADFARRLFASALWFGNAGELDSIEGIESVAGLDDFAFVAGIGCSLAPLARCKALTRLKVAILGDQDVAPIAQLEHLGRLQLYGESIQSLDGLSSSPVQRLGVRMGPSSGFDFLMRLPRLARLLVSTERASLGASERAVLKKLVRRGVAVCAYGHEEWSIALRDLGGILTEAAGFRAVGREDFTDTLQLDSFLF